MEEKKKNTLIILSGPVGAGKSTVACEMVAISENPTVNIEGDKFWSFFKKGFDAFEIKHNFATVMASMVAASIPYASRGYDVILDFTVPPWFLGTVTKIIGERGIQLHYVVLYPSESVCEARALGRSEGKLENYDVFRNLYHSFAEAGSQNIIHDNENSPAELAAQIIEGVKKGTFILNPDFR